jgi:hypothetical protein
VITAPFGHGSESRLLSRDHRERWTGMPGESR